VTLSCAVRVFVLLALLVLAACATAPREPWVLTPGAGGEPLGGDLKRISTYEDALATVLQVMQGELGLPRLQVTLVFLPDARGLEALLLRIGYPPPLARSAARQLVAIGGHRTVLVNQARLESQGWRWRFSILAHELAHVLQYELGGGTRGASAQWLREGFAEWLAARVTASLEQAGEQKARQQAIIRMRNHAQSRFPVTLDPSRFAAAGHPFPARVPVPPLSELRSFPQWLEQSRGEAGPVLLDYAFLAVDTLLEQHGLPVVVRYFELFAVRQDAAANFLEAFGESEEHFEKRLPGILWR
jgi:hypothetical protein